MTWFQYCCRCVACGWDGPQEDSKQRSCPECKAEWMPDYDKVKVSVLIHYAVHQDCGRWHSEGTLCK